ncbi:MAG: DUF6782 family putative metallopeptidase [Actinomycetota bacterium]
MRRDPFLIGIAATVVVLAVATVLTLVVAGDSEPDPTRPATAAEIDATVRVLSAYVERERDLEVPDDVDVDLLTGRRFRRAFGGEEGLSLEDQFGETATTGVALGLVDGSFDFDELGGAYPFGFYDPFRDRVVVHTRRIDALIEVVLVHELTHAAQDHDLGEDDFFPGDAEAALAYTALVEGDATRIEHRYRDQLSDDEGAEYDRHERRLEAEAEALLAEAPVADREAVEFLSRQVLFPYEQGTEFVEELARRDGNDAVDEALEDPPETTEQVLHVDTYLAGEDALDVDDVDAPSGPEVDEVDDGALGEFLLRELLDQRGLDRADARAAAAGWGGDRYVTWEAGNDLGVRVTIVMDTEADAVELEDALARSTDSGDAELVSVVRAAATVSVEFAAVGAG